MFEDMFPWVSLVVVLLAGGLIVWDWWEDTHGR